MTNSQFIANLKKIADASHRDQALATNPNMRYYAEVVERRALKAIEQVLSGVSINRAFGFFQSGK